jgi:23S rRNA (guanosine2251-2'-O)-methyltransferase
MTKDDKQDRSNRDTHYATLRRAVRDSKRERGEIPTPPQKRVKSNKDWKPPQLQPEQVFLYGLHTVRAALANPERKLIKLSVTQNAFARLDVADPAALPFPVEFVSPQDIDKILGPEAIHQGVMLETRPLPVRKLEALKESPLLLVLDQVTDPHNVGAIMRSAVAFGAGALVTTQRHSPTESGVLAKSASGALELIPYIQITNLADALGDLHKLGFQTIGLDSEGPAELEKTFAAERVALVLGSEGKGLRQKTRETVSALARLDMPGEIRSLNVSNAAAVALYAARQHLAKRNWGR